MIKEAIDKILELGQKGIRQTEFKPTAPAGRTYWISHPNGALSDPQISEPAQRAYRTYSQDALAQAVKHFATDDPKCNVVFVGQGQVTAVLDERARRLDRVTLALPHSEPFLTLRKLADEDESEPMDHRDFIRLLRVRLHGCLTEGVLPLFANLKITKNESGGSQVGVGREAMGADVERMVMAGGKDLPEEILVRTAIYRDLIEPELVRPIRCAVDVDLMGPTFTLLPLSGELENAQLATDATILDRLTKNLAGVATVIMGSPG